MKQWLIFGLKFATFGTIVIHITLAILFFVMYLLMGLFLAAGHGGLPPIWGFFQEASKFPFSYSIPLCFLLGLIFGLNRE
jgi:hypothetical protein